MDRSASKIIIALSIFAFVLAGLVLMITLFYKPQIKMISPKDSALLEPPPPPPPPVPSINTKDDLFQDDIGKIKAKFSGIQTQAALFPPDINLDITF